MNIGFNFLPYGGGRHGGAEIYFQNMLYHCATISPTDSFVVIGSGPALDPLLANAPKNVTGLALSPKWTSSRLRRAVAEQLLLPRMIADRGMDVLVSNYVTPLRPGCASLTVIHDLLYKRYPATVEKKKLRYWQTMIPLSLRRSTCVATVSEFSRSELAHFFPHLDSVWVTPEGVRPSLLGQDQGQTIPDIPYFVCVSSFAPHKNLHLVVDALTRVRNRHPNARVQIIGEAKTSDAKAYRQELVEHAKGTDVLDMLDFVGGVEDDGLASAYKNAVAALVPSVYEGFGLPVLEAQTLGCPVIAARAASLPEVVGEGGILIDPGDAKELADAMELLLNSPEQREVLIRQGTKNTARFGWDSGAKTLLQAATHAVDKWRAIR